jgi:type VI protein secretion system component VasK
MDAVAGVSASQRVVAVLKSTPAWLLIGFCLSVLVVWLMPEFQALIPENLQPWVPFALMIGAILTTCKLASLIILLVRERQRALADHDKQKLVRLYRPLAALFLTRHVTSATATGAPYLRHRWRMPGWSLGPIGTVLSR